ncbi:MAG: VgrG-related protein [Acaryochloridaceae cyanobacterium RU_4_10]|nr:VgrG-related protein [Acaryochloridaceae cyanobacterium RU_4_10]
MPNNNPNLYISRPILKLNGADVPDDLMKDVLEIKVDEGLHVLSMFTLKIHNVYVAASEKSEEWRNEKYFNIGDPLSIGFISSITEDPKFRSRAEEQRLIEGEITGIEVNFSNTSEAHIIVTGYDVSHRLHRGRHNRSFLNSTDSDIVRRIAKEVGIQIGQVDETRTPHEYVFQENQTNMEFLRERAARIGFELFVKNNKLYFRKPKSEKSLNLEWLKDISSFTVRVNSDEQVNAVEVNGWDYSQKKLISEKVSTEQLITETGNGKGSSVSQAFKLKQPPKMISVNQYVKSSKEAKDMAQAFYNELSGEFVTADAKAEGHPEIRPGRVVVLANMGARYTGKYYVTRTCHRYSKGVFKTDFEVRGLRQGTLLSTLLPRTHLQPGHTLLVGIVTKNKDPKGWGRVKVKYPTLTEQDESHWARVIGLGASNDRGFYCLPEIDDEVLIGFEHGDIHRPYVIGGVWNGKDKTVETVDDTIKNGKVRLRTIKTRTGHTIQFVEEDDMRSKAGIYITTKAGHQIDLNDSEKFIEIQTAGRHQIRLDDPASTISIRTKMGQSLTFRDPGMKVTLQTTGFVNVKAASGVNVATGGFVNVKAGGFVNVTATGTLSAKTVGPISLMSAANITLAAPTISLSGVVNSPPPIPNPAAIAAAVAAAGVATTTAEATAAPTMI